MCLAVPGVIISISGTDAEIDYDGVTRRASLRLVKNAKAGDVVLVHAGFVIQILDKDDGEELQRLISETMKFIR